MPPKDAKQAYLHWVSSSSSTPCFCRPTLALNLDTLMATPETLAALFGIADPSVVQVMEGATDENLALIPVSENGSGDYYWPLEPDQHYQVSSTTTETDVNVIPIKDIFSSLPGDTADEKSERLQALSNNFYDKIWHDETVPAEFHKKFHFRLSSARIQAFRQYDWLFEVFGGPAFTGEPARENHLVSKVMAKHTSSRMTLEHSVTWLRLMARSMAEVFGDPDKNLQHSLRLYWLHFYGFFPYTEEERRELRRVVFAPKD
mmetsp:Transcript_17922/g.33841  ORF Transcript_17922/g.33841 Transcript_17922/m.33841 type:complete len:260 (+) Transcript_17922:90-869(+)